MARVKGRSMLPTLRDGDILLVRRPAGSPEVGRLVLVDLPARGLAVKRLVAVLPEGLWVERDNPREGVDSWAVGAVPPDRWRGVVLCRVWPWRLRR